MNLWVWRRSADFRLGFSLQGICVLYFILPVFLTKDVLECMVNPTYCIGCCDCSFINLVLKIIVLMLNTAHKMGCKYCYWLGWYNMWRVKSGSLNYPFLGFLNNPFIIFYYFFFLWLSEHSSFLRGYELLLLEHFLFYFNVFVFSYNY